MYHERFFFLLVRFYVLNFLGKNFLKETFRMFQLVFNRRADKVNFQSLLIVAQAHKKLVYIKIMSQKCTKKIKIGEDVKNFYDQENLIRK